MDLKKRKEGIGGSDVAPILGLSKFRTAVDIWVDKLTDKAPEEPRPDDPKTSRMYWGKAFEPEIFNAYADRTCNDTVSGKEIEQLKHKEFPWLIANIDGFAFDGENNGEKILVEVKNCDYASDEAWGDEWTDVIPVEYMLQVQHYLNVTGLQRAHIAARINGLLKIYSVNRSDEIIMRIMPTLEHFWNYNVLQNVAPSAANLSDVRIVYPNAVGTAKTASDEILIKIDNVKKLQLIVKKDQREIDDEKKDIAAHMGECSLLVANDGQKVATFNVRKDGVRVFKVS